MLTVEATIRSVVADDHSPGHWLVSFFELAAYYRVPAEQAQALATLAPGTRVRFTHDHECRIGSIERAA
jgi:hypothetical protein